MKTKQLRNTVPYKRETCQLQDVLQLSTLRVWCPIGERQGNCPNQLQECTFLRNCHLQVVAYQEGTFQKQVLGIPKQSKEEFKQQNLHKRNQLICFCCERGIQG